MRDDPWNSLRFQTCQSFNVPLYTLIYFHTNGIIIYIYPRVCAVQRKQILDAFENVLEVVLEMHLKVLNALYAVEMRVPWWFSRTPRIFLMYLLYFISLIRSTHIYTHLHTCSLYKYIIYYIYQHAYMLYNILTLNFKAFGVTCGTCSWNSANICASRSI